MTDKVLLRTIDGCIGALLSTYFYMIGIRSKKFYDYFFAKERVQETMDRFFPNWQSNRKPSYAAYSRKESKWCRMCLENYNYTKDYLTVLLEEAAYRDGQEHSLACIYHWIEHDMPHIDLPKAGLN